MAISQNRLQGLGRAGRAGRAGGRFIVLHKRRTNAAGHLVMANWFYDTVSATIGRIKAYLAGVFTAKPIKVWTGAAWVTKPLKRWNGSAWVQTTY